MAFPAVTAVTAVVVIGNVADFETTVAEAVEPWPRERRRQSAPAAEATSRPATSGPGGQAGRVAGVVAGGRKIRWQSA